MSRQKRTVTFSNNTKKTNGPQLRNPASLNQALPSIVSSTFNDSPAPVLTLKKGIPVIHGNIPSTADVQQQPPPPIVSSTLNNNGPPPVLTLMSNPALTLQESASLHQHQAPPPNVSSTLNNGSTRLKIIEEIHRLIAERDTQLKRITEYFNERLSEYKSDYNYGVMSGHGVYERAVELNQQYYEFYYYKTLNYYQEMIESLEMQALSMKGGKSTKRTRKHKSKRHSRRK
jgi:hypothetical protein